MKLLNPKGDSGGQLMLPDKTLVGIVSWGYGCGQPNYPGAKFYYYSSVQETLNSSLTGVYTEIAFLRSWIEQHVKVY